jgi:hypothetical protein
MDAELLVLATNSDTFRNVLLYKRFVCDVELGTTSGLRWTSERENLTQ